MDTYEENGIMPDPNQQEAPMPEQDDPTPAEEVVAESSDMDQPRQEELISAQEQADEFCDSDDGFYHGAGAGAKESMLSPVAEETTSNSSETAQQPVEEPVSPKKRRCKKVGLGKKILKCSVVTVLIVALIAAGCGISVAVTNQYWWSYYQTVQRNFEQQIDVLRQQLENIQPSSGDEILIPQEGLTPAQIYEMNIQSVVAINCILRTTSDGKVYESQSSGSGFVMSADGYIVTNHHVIDGATTINVVFEDGTKLGAVVVGSDATNDIALLKVAAENLKPVTIGSSSALRVGNQVVAIGNALGELSFSLTVGYVSGMDRNVTTDGSVMNMIQADVSINSGNSGGPLFNAKGEVIGITTAKYSGTTSSGASIEGISFAIPMDDVIDMLDDLKNLGYISSSYLGVMVRDLDPSVAEVYGLPMGAYILEITPGFAAEKAGLMPKDIITNVGGYKVENMSDLTRALRKLKAGETTTISVWRSGRQIVLNIVLDEKPRS